MKIRLSTVTPVYKGEKFLYELVHEIEALRTLISKKYNFLDLTESIFVLDGCVDNSKQILTKLSEEKDWVHIVELSKNFGQHPATIAGLMHTSGDWVFTLDEDLQHHPKHIISLLHKSLLDSADICYVKSKDNIHNSYIKDKISDFFKRIIGLLSGNKDVINYSSFRCIRGSIARGASSTCSPDSYLDVSLNWFSNNITTMVVKLNDIRNQSGNQGSYSILKLMSHGKRLILSSKLKFLRIFVFLGLISFLVSILYTCVILILKFKGYEIPIQGWTSTIISIYFFGGIVCLLLGVILESISDMLLKTKGKPLFFTVDRSKDSFLLEAFQNNDESL